MASSEAYSDSEVAAILSRFMDQQVDVEVVQSLKYTPVQMSKILKEIVGATGPISFRRYSERLDAAQIESILDTIMTAVNRPSA